jgi:cell division protease FtsH
MGGYTACCPLKILTWILRSKFKDYLAVFMGGRVAEELIYNEMTTGAAQDMKQATDLARKMVTVYGMSDKMGPRTYGQKEEMIFLGREISEQRDYSEKTALQIDGEVNKLIEEAHEMALKILMKIKERLIHIAQVLISRETLEGEDMETVLNGGICRSFPRSR